MSKDILIVFGTRPDAIKMAPLVAAFRDRPNDFSAKVCVTAQHREMLDQVLTLFDLQPDYDLNLMRPNQTLTEITVSVIRGLKEIFQSYRPDWVVIQGDTSTAFAAGLAAFYEQIKVAHVEAGLRSGNKLAPWPEEVNRQLTTIIADIHFAPTEDARENLLRAGIPSEGIHVTGNTVIDAVLATLQRIEKSDELLIQLKEQFSYLDPDKRLILVTGHRRESFGPRFESICEALHAIIAENEGVELVYPVHLNPNVQEPVMRILGGNNTAVAERIHLIDPVEYHQFVYLMSRAYIIITDSGGVQEEAPSLHKPVLVMRDTTERGEVVAQGMAKLVGSDTETIRAEANRLLIDDHHYAKMVTGENPYGDGKAAERIATIIGEAN